MAQKTKLGINFIYAFFIVVILFVGVANLYHKELLSTKKTSNVDKTPPPPKIMDIAEIFAEVQNELRQRGPPECANINGIFKIPAVKKGMNNQRMRIVQDIMTAQVLGAAVELPVYLNTRLNCHNRHDCYKNYENGMKLWDVFDEDRSMRALEKMGVCVFKPSQFPVVADIVPTPLKIPSPYTNDKAIKYVKDSNTKLSNGYWSLGNENDCCSKYIPTDKRSVKLLRGINGAFFGISSITDLAKDVISSLQQQNKNLAIALHWRQDEDFVKTAHALDADKYFKSVKRTLVDIMKTSKLESNKHILNVILLGDLNVTEAIAIQKKLNADRRLNVVVHTKNTIMPHVDFDSMFHGADDVKGQVDFEIGVYADYFIGSPFSSMSVLIAFNRDQFIINDVEEKKGSLSPKIHGVQQSQSSSSFFSIPQSLFPSQESLDRKIQLSTSNKLSSSTKSIMLKVDVKDRLARIFGIQFPYFEKEPHFTKSLDPCKDIIKAHPAFSRNVAKSCELETK